MLDKHAIEYTWQNATRRLIIIIIGVYRTKPCMFGQGKFYCCIDVISFVATRR